MKPQSPEPPLARDKALAVLGLHLIAASVSGMSDNAWPGREFVPSPAISIVASVFWGRGGLQGLSQERGF